LYWKCGSSVEEYCSVCITLFFHVHLVHNNKLGPVSSILSTPCPPLIQNISLTPRELPSAHHPPFPQCPNVAVPLPVPNHRPIPKRTNLPCPVTPWSMIYVNVSIVVPKTPIPLASLPLPFRPPFWQAHGDSSTVQKFLPNHSTTPVSTQVEPHPRTDQPSGTPSAELPKTSTKTVA